MTRRCAPSTRKWKDAAGRSKAGDEAVKKTAFMDWIDGEMTADPTPAGVVDELLDEMRLEQQLAALR
jgi:hypothetical protein